MQHALFTIAAHLCIWHSPSGTQYIACYMDRFEKCTSSRVLGRYIKTEHRKKVCCHARCMPSKC